MAILTGYNIIGVLITLTIILGIKLLSSPKTAVKGNMLGAIAMLAAVIVTLTHNDIIGQEFLWLALLVGGFIGVYIARKVEMIQMPQMVALLNGFGGGASALVALIIFFSNYNELSSLSRFTTSLALMIGSITLSGSLIAAAKLDGRIGQKSVILKKHALWNLISLVTPILLTILITFNIGVQTAANLYIIPTFLFSLVFGIVFAIRVGGADMPITISLLNSMSGLAASIAGFAIYNPLLIVVGAIVGASGLILTQIMCKAMNRSLLEVLAGNSGKSKGKKDEKMMSFAENNDIDKAIEEEKVQDYNYDKKLKEAESVVIVPGYGMALAQAQAKVKNLYDNLENQGKEVNFAIHPVAGRMPGHMNVLLAEVDIPYDKLLELEAANLKFEDTDLVIVVGANDVINPAAKTEKGTPIYGMPILNVYQADNVMILNLDQKPGYAGVENPLYNDDKVSLLLGDAKDSLQNILNYIN
jgi:NAD(P) transhydrogenase subunit beta